MEFRPSPDDLDALGDPPDGMPLTQADYEVLVTEFATEWVDGRLRYLPWGTERESAVFTDLILRAGQHVRALTPPARMTFRKFHLRTPSGFRSPSVMLRRDGGNARPDCRWWDRADVVIEIVSPRRPGLEYGEKRDDYAAAGVPEYWIVDPRPAVREIVVQNLEGGTYRHRTFRDGETAEGTTFPGFALDVTECLDADP